MELLRNAPPARPHRRTVPRRITAAAIAVGIAATLVAPATAATAAPVPAPTPIVGTSTQPVFEYAEAIRERVYIPVEGVDQDRDGVTDRTAIDIVRPDVDPATLAVPAIIDPSPYFTTVGRGNESQKLSDQDGDGVTDLFPLFYDNYFVPRGYAVIHAQMNGTGFSTGCPLHGGSGDIASMKVVIDWLQGRVPGFDAAGDPVTADWHNGRAGMIGKSYDGTLANGVAATGVDGLSTIVPIDAISEWYRYSRTNGIRHNTDYPASLSSNVTNEDRRAVCAPTRDEMNAIDGDETGDINAFWQERDYRADADKVRASVFAVHGLNDDNVRMSQFAEYWDTLGASDVPRKVWLPRVGHVDPFDFRREVWVDTLHRWFDYWLYGLENGIMSEPQSTVESDPAVYLDEVSWPAPGAEQVDVHVTGQPGTEGSLALAPTEGATTIAFTGPGNSPNETALITGPEGQQSSRLVMLSEPLEQDLRISGTPTVRLDASLSQEQTNLGALLVDYSTAARTPRGTGDGVQNLATRTCWGGASAFDNACYLEVERRSATTDFWRVSRGVLDSSNRDTLIDGQATPVVPGQMYGFDWTLEPYDYTFRAGSRIGLVLTTNMSGFVAGSPGATVTIDATSSSLVLPVVGGLDAAARSGAFGAPAPVTLSFDVGGQGTAPAAQEVAYGSAPTAPADPTADGLGFGGWYADAALTTPFDFSSPLTASTTAYARWLTVAERIASIELEMSAPSVPQGGTLTATVEGFDADGESLGDVTSLAVLTSSVATDVFSGSTVSFPQASPHTITATVNGLTSSVTVEVIPADTPVTDEREGGVGAIASGLAATGGGALALVGLTAAAALLVVGAVLLTARRRRRLS